MTAEQKLYDKVRKLDRNEIVELLEGISIVCFDDEPLDLLVECLAENVQEGLIEEYQLDNE